MKKHFNTIIAFIVLTIWITISIIFFGCLFLADYKKCVYHHCNESTYKENDQVCLDGSMMYSISSYEWKRFPNQNRDSNYMLMKNQNKQMKNKVNYEKY